MLKYAFPENAYTPVGLEKYHIDQSDAKKEYQRLRKIANERLRKLAKAGYTDTRVYKDYIGFFTPYSKIRSTRMLAIQLSNVRHFLDLKTSTVGGQHTWENKVLQKLHENEYYFVTHDNLKKFGEFMEYVMETYKGKEYPSDKEAMIWDISETKNIPADILMKDFEYWQHNIDELSQTKPIEKGLSRNEYESILEKRKKQIEKDKKKRGL